MLHSLFTSLLMGLGLLAGGASTPATFGSISPVGGTQYTLAGAGINSTQSTIQLASFTTPDGRPLVMSMFGTVGYGALEPHTTARLEDITFSGITQNTNGTATLTGVTRGNDFVTPYAASSTLAHSHAGGATFILTNTAGFYTQFYSLNNNATSTGILTFSSTSPPRLDQPGAQATGNYIATTSEFATVAYVNATGAGTVVNATTGVKGVVQIATGLQAASSTAAAGGSTGATLALPTNIATDTPSATGSQRTSLVVMSNLLGFISQTWLDLTANWSFTGAVSIAASASKNLTLNSVAYKFPTAQGSATSTLLNDGNGTLSWTTSASRMLQLATASTTIKIVGNNGTTTMYTIRIPANTLSATNSLRVEAAGYKSNDAANCYMDIQLGNGSASTTLITGTINYQSDSSGLIMATSTSGGYAHFTTSSGLPVTGGQGVPTLGTKNTWLANSFNSDLFMAVTFAEPGSGATCFLNDFMAEVISN